MTLLLGQFVLTFTVGSVIMILKGWVGICLRSRGFVLWQKAC